MADWLFTRNSFLLGAFILLIAVVLGILFREGDAR
jgi:hypothetical protein